MSGFIVKDHYYHKAKSEGFLARSIFKLKEIDENLKLIKPHFKVLDLGCAPGSWLQYVSTKILSTKGLILGIDLTPVSLSLGPHVITKQEDVFLLTKEKVVEYLNLSDFQGFDLILSDMAPKTTGIKHVDQLRSLSLAEKAHDLVKDLLNPEGHMVIKIFQSADVSNLVNELKQTFRVVKQMRPKSIRSVSKELYLVGLFKKD